MNISLHELAERLGGKLHGDGNTPITGAATLRDCGQGDITFVSRPRHQRQLRKVAAAAVLVSNAIVPEGIPYVVVENVNEAFAKLVELFRPSRPHRSVGISPQAFVSESAQIGRDVEIHAGASVGDEVAIGEGSVIHCGARIGAGSKIGAGVEVFPNAVIYEDTVVGDRSIVHACAVVGAFGFGYDSDSSGHRLAPQLGNVEIGSDVEIGACSTIDRGTYGPTKIGDGTKIDNLVMVAHNCHIGSHNLICAQVGLAGSCTVGNFVVMAGQVGVRDHLRIGDRTTLGAKAGVIGHVKTNTTVVGIPASDVRDQMNKQAAISHLPQLRAQVKQLESLVAQLNERLKQLECDTPKLWQPSESEVEEHEARAA